MYELQERDLHPSPTACKAAALITRKNEHPISNFVITRWMPLGALEWTRTTTPLMAQALNLLRIPFRHEGIRADYGVYDTLALWLCQQF
jgi:hypothetical protein